MARKKKLSNSVPTSPKPNQLTSNPEEILTNVKAKISDENLINTVEPDKMKKRSLVSLPTEGEEEDEFLFIRLRKQIKGHWDKIMENGTLFFRPHHTTHSNIAVAGENEIIRTDSMKTNNSTTTTSTIASTASSAIAPAENNLFSSSIKSIFLLPAFSCNRDDEGRKIVPFISSLLQV